MLRSGINMGQEQDLHKLASGLGSGELELDIRNSATDGRQAEEIAREVQRNRQNLDVTVQSDSLGRYKLIVRRRE